MWWRKNTCPNCNAPLAEGTSFCAYCGLNSRGSARAPSVQGTRGGGRSWLKIGLGLTSLLCCGPMGLFLALHEAVYAIHMEAPQYSARPPSVEQRPTEAITASQVFLDMRSTDDHPLAQRKQEWRERYEGHWVSWKGVVEQIQPYDSMASELVLRPEPGQKYTVQVNFDPIYSGRLKQLHTGQEVHVSGRLWGYYFMDDTVRLSEGVVLDPEGPGQVQEHPL